VKISVIACGVVRINLVKKYLITQKTIIKSHKKNIQINDKEKTSMSMKFFQRIFSILLLVGMLLGFVQPGVVQANTPDINSSDSTIDKIEELLIDRFNSEGSADFVVNFSEQADLSSAYQMSWEERGWFVYNTLTEIAQRSQQNAKGKLDEIGLRYQTFIAGNEMYVWGGNLDSARMLAELPEVEFIRATRTYYIDPVVETPSPLFNATWAGDLLANNAMTGVGSPTALDWGITDTNADDFWTQFGQGNGIVVANIDTGVQWNHPALDQAFKCGTDPTDPACWSDPSNICGGSMCDNNGHGTHTMGTMVGDDDPGLTWQAGMAPDAQWIACKGCESSSCSDTALNACADWILAPDGNPANRPNVVNNSWGGGGGDNWYQAKVQAWRAAGIFPAFSAGNSTGCSSMGSPGDYQESFASTGHNSSRVHYYAQGPSAFGHDPYTKPNLSAPAVSVCSSVPTNSWSCSYSGTSMASPHSAGAVALLWACNPDLIGQIDQTFELLQNNTDPPDPPNPSCGVPPDGQGTYEDGYGYLNVYNAGLMACGETGTLAGHVYEVGTGDPIEGATVIATPVIQGNSGIQAVTDPNGYYTMTLLVGTYDVTASALGYEAYTVYDVVVETNTVTTVDFSLALQGTLFGYVTDADNGFALIGATVSADDGSSTTTDGNGYYEMFLDEGTHVVTATMADYAPETAIVDIVSGANTQQDFALLAAISVVPDPIHAYVVLGQTGSLDAMATNNLPQDYPFDFIEIEGGAVVGGHSITGSGGPDPFGYTYVDSNEVGGARYEWVDATDGTPLGLGDDGEANVTLPFSFNFYGTDSTAIRVGNNGGLLFGVTVGDLAVTNENLGTTTTNNLIVPFWDDIDSDTGDVYYKTVGTAPYRQFIVEWFNRPHYSNIGNATFELILYETTNNIKYQYQDVVFGNVSYDNGASATVGIRQTGSNYLQYSYNQPFIQDSMAICFQYPGSPPCDGGDVSWFGESIASGTVPANGGTLSWTNVFTATEGAGIVQPGDYFATLRMQPTTGGLPVKLVPVIMTVLPTPTQGLLEGVVSGDRPGGPLVADILIESSGGMTWTLTSDPGTGYYSWWLDGDTYTVTASAPGYLSESANVIVIGSQTTVQDFILLRDAAGIAIAPLSLEVTLELGQATAETLTISNTGLQPLDFQIRERGGDFIPGIDANSILLMGDDLTSADWDTYRLALTAAGQTWDEWDLLTLPFPTAGDLTPYEALIWTDDNTLDPGDAECQIVADWLISGGKSLFGIGRDFIWDLANGTPGAGEYNLYLLLNTQYLGDYAGTTITSLDGIPGDPIGGDFSPPNGLTLAGTLDSDGDYASTSSIATTGLIYGPGGAGSNNAGLTHYEGADYKLVWLGVNFHDGLTNQDQRNLLMENSMAFLVGGDVPWLVEEPITGTVGVGASIDISVSFDASIVAEPGDYLAELSVQNNDPYNGQVTVPITMHVLPSADLGLLQGIVSGLGYCDAESYPLEANILIENSTGMTWTLTSDPGTGYYSRWLDGDTYTVTASAPDHLDGMGVVQVTPLQTTTLDLDLRFIESCMDVSPTAFTVTLPADTQITETLSIMNSGAGELIWELHETTATLRTLDQEVMVNVPAISIPEGVVGSRSEAISYPARQFSMHIGQISLAPINVLIVTPDVVGGGDITLLLNTLAAFPDLIVTVWDATVGTPTVADMQAYDVVFVGNDILWTSSAIDKLTLSNNLADFVDAGGKVLAASFIWSYDDWGFGGGRFITDDYSPFEIATVDFFQLATLGTFDPTSPIMAGITNVTDNFNHQDPALSSNGVWVANWNDGENFVGVAPNVVGLNQEYFHNADFGGQTGELLHNALVYLGGAQQWIDVPWVSEVPTSGVTLPDSTFDVNVIFDSTGLTLGECYTARLGLIHDDPGQNSPFMIPLSLCIVEPAYGVQLSPDQTQMGIAGDLVTYMLTITNTGNTVDSFDLSLGSYTFTTTLSTDSVGPLNAGASVTFEVYVQIPPEANPGDSDNVTVTATSQGDPMVMDDAILTTEVVGYGVDLEPETSAGIGMPGNQITYTLRLTNTGDIADTIVLTYTNVDPGWIVEVPVFSFDLAAGQGVDVIVVVTIPLDAGNGDFDNFTVTATSSHDPLAFDDVSVTTTVETGMFNIFLPIIFKN
jgi:Subtilase family/Carboxypeptidase regulatory-like domain